MDGLLLLDKPQGPTSFDMIRLVRKSLRTRKVGHTGTLDPDATGLLPIAIGKATKFAQFLILDRKTYEFELHLGAQNTAIDCLPYGSIRMRRPKGGLGYPFPSRS